MSMNQDLFTRVIIDVISLQNTLPGNGKSTFS